MLQRFSNGDASTQGGGHSPSATDGSAGETPATTPGCKPPRLSRHYFGVSARGLTREQSAMLAAVLPNPKGWDPAKPGPMLRWRQQRILRRERNANFPEKLLK